MKYHSSILRRVQKSLEKISGSDYDKIVAAIFSLEDNPRPVGCKKLSGRNGWRIRVGDFRILYEINDSELIILVIDIGHRREVYR